MRSLRYQNGYASADTRPVRLRAGGSTMDIRRCGGMAEWTIATVLKTVNPHGFVGSNPTPSANRVMARSPLQPGLSFLQQFSEQRQDLIDAQHDDGADAALQVAFVH